MNGIKVYQTPNGWIFEVRFQGSIIIIGCRSTLEAAHRAALQA